MHEEKHDITERKIELRDEIDEKFELFIKFLIGFFWNANLVLFFGFESQSAEFLHLSII